MARTILDMRPVTDQFIELLRGGTQKKIGDHQKPDDVPENEPWAIVYVITGGGLDGPWGDPLADATPILQVSNVGRSRSQCQWMRDATRRVVLKRNDGTGWVTPWPHTLDPPDPYSIIGRVLDEPGGGIEPAGPAGQLLFTAVDRFKLTVTPS